MTATWSDSATCTPIENIRAIAQALGTTNRVRMSTYAAAVILSGRRHPEVPKDGDIGRWLYSIRRRHYRRIARKQQARR